MRMTEPRITPLPREEWTPEQRETLAPIHDQGEIYHVLGTIARHWPAFRRFYPWANHIMGDSLTLAQRDREILILRVARRCNSGYEWLQHVVFGRRAGLSAEEIKRIEDGPDAPGWTPHEAALLRAADELHDDAFITDATWKSLGQSYSNEQLMDVVFTVGQYHLVAMALNSFGVQPDPGLLDVSGDA